MAEALINHALGSRIQAISAGTHPGPKVAVGALAALRLAGIPTHGLYPKSVDTVINKSIDLVVTVCDNAREACPVFPKAIPSLHMPFHDPHGEPLSSFVKVLDDINVNLLPELKRRFSLLDTDEHC